MSDLARTLLARRLTPVTLVIFDCDGVLIDSELVANRVVAEELTALGWAVTAEECDRMFLGMSYHDMAVDLERRLARKLPDRWLDDLLARVITLMETEVETVPGAREALACVAQLPAAWCVASNSSHREMAAKFACTGLTAMMRGRMYSGHEMQLLGKRAKPAPDLFLHAAGTVGIAPESCLVIEDSPTGIQAARAAGMDCLGLARHGQGDAHAALGAAPFTSMHDLPDLLRLATETR